MLYHRKGYSYTIVTDEKFRLFACGGEKKEWLLDERSGMSRKFPKWKRPEWLTSPVIVALAATNTTKLNFKMNEK